MKSYVMQNLDSLLYKFFHCNDFLERVTILKCLLDIRRIFNKSNGGECRYLYNQLFIDDLCLWVQSVDLEILKNLSFYLCENLHLLNKSLIELDLEVFL